MNHREPRTLRDFLRELRTAMEAEVPVRLHQRGVEADEAGGSALGTPKWSSAFRAYVTGIPSQLTQDGDYRWPLRASVSRMCRSGWMEQEAARFVWLTLAHDFDWLEAARILTETTLRTDSRFRASAQWIAVSAFRLWWQRYREEPLRIGAA